MKTSVYLQLAACAAILSCGGDGTPGSKPDFSGLDWSTPVFEDVSEAAGFRAGGSNTGAAWVGFDDDGDLDFFVARRRTGFGDRLQLVDGNKLWFMGNANDGEDGFSFSHSGSRLTLSVSFPDCATQPRWIFIGSSGRHPPRATGFLLNESDPRNVGQPPELPSEDTGLFIWRTAQGWQVRWKGDRFMGTVESNGSIRQLTPIDLEPYDSSSPRTRIPMRFGITAG